MFVFANRLHCGRPTKVNRFVFSLLDRVCPRCSRHVRVVTQLLSKTLGPPGFEKNWWALHLWTSCCCGIRDCPSSKSQSTYFEHVFNLDAQSRYIRLSMPGPLPRHNGTSSRMSPHLMLSLGPALYDGPDQRCPRNTGYNNDALWSTTHTQLHARRCLILGCQFVSRLFQCVRNSDCPSPAAYLVT